MWKSFAAYATMLLFFRRAERVVMLHSDRPVHLVDRMVTGMMLRTCLMVWADSQSTAERAARVVGVDRIRKLSFRTSALSASPRKAPRLDFVFWGRLTALKNIPAALDLIHTLKKSHQNISFTVIGPDTGCLADLQARVAARGLEPSVAFLGYRRHSDIVSLAENCSFFLQLSHQEGMAMSVVEAMQLGLVPVVTPVGEIVNYCRHMENGIIHRDIPSTVAAIEAAVANPERYAAMSRAAIETWRDAPLYADDFAAAAAELFATTREGVRP